MITTLRATLEGLAFVLTDRCFIPSSVGRRLFVRRAARRQRKKATTQFLSSSRKKIGRIDIRYYLPISALLRRRLRFSPYIQRVKLRIPLSNKNGEKNLSSAYVKAQVFPGGNPRRHYIFISCGLSTTGV